MVHKSVKGDTWIFTMKLVTEIGLTELRFRRHFLVNDLSTRKRLLLVWKKTVIAKGLMKNRKHYTYKGFLIYRFHKLKNLYRCENLQIRWLKCLRWPELATNNNPVCTYIMAILHVYNTNITCTSHRYHMYITPISHVHHTNITCTSHQYHMHKNKYT